MRHRPLALAFATLSLGLVGAACSGSASDMVGEAGADGVVDTSVDVASDALVEAMTDTNVGSNDTGPSEAAVEGGASDSGASDSGASDTGASDVGAGDASVETGAANVGPPPPPGCPAVEPLNGSACTKLGMMCDYGPVPKSGAICTCKVPHKWHCLLI